MVLSIQGVLATTVGIMRGKYVGERIVIDDVVVRAGVLAPSIQVSFARLKRSSLEDMLEDVS